MTLYQVFLEAFRSLGMNRLRTGLTLLGMLIGVGAVVLMVAIGEGTRAKVKSSIDSMGSHLLIILPGSQSTGAVRFGGGTSQTLTLSDAQAISQLPSIAAVAPIVSRNFQLASGNRNWSTQVSGTTPEYFSIRSWDIEEGDGFSDTDLKSANRVVILGKTTAENLFGENNPIGQTLRIRNAPFSVIGILATKGQSLDGRDQDDSAFIPLTTAKQQLIASPFPGSINLLLTQAKSAEQMTEAETDMSELLRIRHRLREGAEDDFTIRNLASIAQTAAVAAQAMALMLGAIASISLLVGGIGIMNIMLVSVTERTREIGIRMALGARQMDILIQFLTEALVICAVGGATGIALGLGGAWLVSSLADMSVEVTFSSMLIAFSFSGFIGLFFGFYPAHKASKLKPVEALRYE